jgi:hypothetical protein
MRLFVISAKFTSGIIGVSGDFELLNQVLTHTAIDELDNQDTLCAAHRQHIDSNEE